MARNGDAGDMQQRPHRVENGTAGLLDALRRFTRRCELYWLARPAVSLMSLNPSGMPARGPRAETGCWSIRWARAPSISSVANAFTTGSRATMRSRQASSTSSADRDPRLIAARLAVAVSGSVMGCPGLMVRVLRGGRRGAPLSPVDGMPLAVKDMIEIRDLPTAMNSPIYPD